MLTQISHSHYAALSHGDMHTQILHSQHAPGTFTTQYALPDIDFTIRTPALHRYALPDIAFTICAFTWTYALPDIDFTMTH